MTWRKEETGNCGRLGNADEDKEGCLLNDQPDTKSSKEVWQEKEASCQGENQKWCTSSRKKVERSSGNQIAEII
jgi:hypothetical protein